jgi:hypothetical protein
MVTKHISQEDYDLLQKVKQQKFKDLTDEEIVYLAKRFEGVWDGAVDYKGFARAILRKAQE